MRKRPIQKKTSNKCLSNLTVVCLAKTTNGTGLWLMCTLFTTKSEFGVKSSKFSLYQTFKAGKRKTFQRYSIFNQIHLKKKIMFESRTTHFGFFSKHQKNVYISAPS